MNSPRYWLNTVSKDHVLAGVAGGFTQANHGKSINLKHLSKGDWLVFYSSKTSLSNGKSLQNFTALGKITGEAPYQAEMSPSFHPWRRQVAFMPCQETPIRPLITDLSFIKDKKAWGYPFRRGLFEIPEADFKRIAKAMGVNLAAL